MKTNFASQKPHCWISKDKVLANSWNNFFFPHKQQIQTIIGWSKEDFFFFHTQEEKRCCWTEKGVGVREEREGAAQVGVWVGPVPFPEAELALSRAGGPSGCTWGPNSLEDLSSAFCQEPRKTREKKWLWEVGGRLEDLGLQVVQWADILRSGTLSICKTTGSRSTRKLAEERGLLAWGRGNGAADEQPKNRRKHGHARRCQKWRDISVIVPSGAMTTSAEDGRDEWRPRTPGALDRSSSQRRDTGRTQILAWLKKKKKILNWLKTN